MTSRTSRPGSRSRRPHRSTEAEPVIAVAVLAFVGGLAVGSFVTVVAHRVPRRESIVSPASRCPSCGAPIAPYDNVPVLSWALLRGRARCCGAQIPVRYPLAELSLGVLYAATV